MHFSTSSLILLASAGLISATPTPDFFKRQADGGQCLLPEVASPNSALTGQDEGVSGIKAGQAPSATDPNNFINFCAGQTITNGEQENAGSCNPVPMGRIPGVDQMVSSIILQPAHNDAIPASVTFNVNVQVSNFQAGSFTNPDVTYYSAPQDLNEQGNIIGHCHITISRLGDNPQDNNNVNVPPNPRTHVFFKGVDDAGNGAGLLTAVVEGGLTPGFYRVCTMLSASNHQPVLMPVANRGAQDDCTKFTVVDTGVPPIIEEEDEEDDLEAGVVPPAGAPVVEDPAADPADPNAPVVEDPAAEAPAVEVPPVPEVIEPTPGQGPVETPAEEAPPVELQPELAQITDAIIDLANGLGGPGELIRIASGVLGGQSPFVLESGDANSPFSVNSVLFANAQDAVARSCRLQFRTCRAAAQGGNVNMEDCAEQRRNCGAEPQDIAVNLRRKKMMMAKKN